MRRILVLISAIALTVMLAVAPALAQNQTGLVNVNIEDNTIQVPISVAANLCDINVAVLVADFQDDGRAECTATAESTASKGPGKGGGTGNPK